ncbi:Crp/Fnr family transcriptional regulator [Pedobacter duraquae]|uniref:CRP-like cAMP-binding protein n=1 Tax=Pedobacter duraquae TaxID=425511 RepID=A0A4R6IGE6_9SPHI|nr:Crp/Fnr family transcriptional regulator [Pedobacter duraquae]TDO20841.1 CRP-like cAMP-binding protein [Pedobacter duraquae]
MRYAKLYENFSRYTLIAESEYARIEDLLVKRYIKKKHVLIERGEVSRYVYFVLNGSVRSYTLDQSGVEHVMQLAFEGHWITDLSSFITQNPGEMIVEAIEDTEVLLLAHHDLQLLFEEIPALEKFFRKLYERAYVSLQKRVTNRESVSAKERYLELIALQPHIAQRIPLIYIASYLGITPESLSRIRNSIANEK